MRRKKSSAKSAFIPILLCTLLAEFQRWFEDVQRSSFGGPRRLEKFDEPAAIFQTSTKIPEMGININLKMNENEP